MNVIKVYGIISICYIIGTKMKLEPTFPTIIPLTKCSQPAQYGTWTIDRDTDMRDLLLEQQRCLKKENDNKLEISNTISHSNNLILDPQRVHVHKQIIEDVVNKSNAVQKAHSENEQCKTNIISNYSLIRHYCKNLDGTELDVMNLMQGCQTGIFNLHCADPNAFDGKTHALKCGGKPQGIYMCTDGTVSCTPCAFDRLGFEQALHQGFLERHCNGIDGDTDACKKFGFNDEAIYNQGMEHRWYSYKDNHKNATPLDSSPSGGAPPDTPSIEVRIWNVDDFTATPVKRFNLTRDQPHTVTTSNSRGREWNVLFKNIEFSLVGNVAPDTTVQVSMFAFRSNPPDSAVFDKRRRWFKTFASGWEDSTKSIVPLLSASYKVHRYRMVPNRQHEGYHCVIASIGMYAFDLAQAQIA